MMGKLSRKLRITIVGAGMSGSMVAALLARQGHRVSVYESRSDIRVGSPSSGRSLNMTLSERGFVALRRLGIEETIKKLCVPVHGRRIHDRRGQIKFFPYSSNPGPAASDPSQYLHAIKRNDLNAALLSEAARQSTVELNFQKKFLRMDKTTATAVFRDELTQETFSVEADFLIGADGSFSKVRRSMQKGEPADNFREFLDWDYRELLIPATNGSYAIEPHALHAWPRGDCMLMALPNQNGSFNCICSMPRDGRFPNFAYFERPNHVRDFFESLFPDAVPLIPDLEELFLEKSSSTFFTTRTNVWSHGERVVLIGDACHTAVPFYGQGMISALEDCVVLADCLDRCGQDRGAAFLEFQNLRKPNTDALAEISVQNFVELRDSIRKPTVVARKRGEDLIGRLLPQLWTPLYTMIAHTDLPYAEALARYRRQRRIASFFGFDAMVLVGAAALATRSALARWWRDLRRRVVPQNEASRKITHF